MTRTPDPGDPDDDFDWAGPSRGVHRPNDTKTEQDFPPPQGPAGVATDTAGAETGHRPPESTAPQNPAAG